MSAVHDSAALIDEAEAIGRKVSPGTSDSDARFRLAATVGVMSRDIRRLCEQLERLRTAQGIADSIARLPSRHADLLVILKAAQERIEAEDARGDRTGYDSVAEYLVDAVSAMGEAGANDAEEMRIEYAHERACDERAELRGCSLYRSGS